MKSLKELCIPRPSVFAADRRATVLNLDTFLKGEVKGTEFFEENFFTNGMLTLVDRAFRHLGGSGAGSSVFLLSQAMGGGKTHSMIALGLLARDPDLRKKVLGDANAAPQLGKCRVVGFNGRSTDAAGGIWGSIAEQLGKAAQFAKYVSPLLSAPGPEAWKQLLGAEPLVLFLDELPPYLEYAVAVPVGNADLGVVTTTALANLFIAVGEMENVCLVLSDLAGTNFSIGQSNLEAAFNRAVQGITAESRRIAVPITPVNPNGDELYHILRKRLFEHVAPETEKQKVAAAYREALREAAKMNLTTSSPESLYARVIDAYPFHPDLRELVGKFKENDGFQQTRGVIRLMQMVVSDLWKSEKAAGIDLIHPYDLDLNLDEIASEIRTINPSLSEAIAHDIAHSGDAEVEQIDIANGNSDASDAARLILIASLSTTPGAIHGLREYQLVDCLQRPGRNLATFKANVLDKLATRAWYLHNSADGRLFFKNQQNLAAKLRATALSLHSETVDRMLREHLEEYFSASLRDCYQVVKVLPPPDEVQVEQDKITLIIVRPGGQANQLPISADWQAWWSQQQYKNRVLFLTGSRDTFQKVLDSARQTRALQSIEDELKAENTPSDDPQWRALDALRDRVGLQFTAALKEAFDQIVYPSINSALRTTGTDLAFAGNQSGEATIRKTLEGAQKFTTKIDDDSFRTRAEARLFGTAETKVVLWSDFKRAAAVNTNWPLHKISALDDLKTESVRRGLWREEGNHIRRGPFPPPVPEVSIRELSIQEDGDGHTFLKIEPLHAPSVVYETGDSEPTTASSPVPTPSRFEATGIPLAPSWLVDEFCKVGVRWEHRAGADHLTPQILSVPQGEIAAWTGDSKKKILPKGATVSDSRAIDPFDANRSWSVEALRGSKGLRRWSNDDVVPRPGDVFQERLYCIRWVKTVTDPDGTVREIRRYDVPDESDLAREAKVLKLLQERFSAWQREGFIPSKAIVSGYNTDQPTRERGWSHWHHLFTPRQLLTHGLLASLSSSAQNQRLSVVNMLNMGRLADWDCRLCCWLSHKTQMARGKNTFLNQALNTLFNYSNRPLPALAHAQISLANQSFDCTKGKVKTSDARDLREICDFWITDPPYADAVNYHELGDFFLAWYDKQLAKAFPEWTRDARAELAVRGDGEDFRRSMVEIYKNLARHMPDNGMQMVQFTHQDPGVWADLGMILWAAGLKATAAWTISTETEAVGLKKGNYVQGTVCLVLRKRTSNDPGFLDEVYPLVEDEVKRQIASMQALDEAGEPNFNDADYQLAAYAAALKVLTQYGNLDGKEVEHEVFAVRAKNQKSDFQIVIERALGIACDTLVPRGLDNSWRELSLVERYYLRALDIESRGERRQGMYEELARGFGVTDIKPLLKNDKANGARMFTPSGLAAGLLAPVGGAEANVGVLPIRRGRTGSGMSHPFAASPLRHLIFAIRETTAADNSPEPGRQYLRDTFGQGYWGQRERFIALLEWLTALGNAEGMNEWITDSEAARILAGRLRNDHA